MSPREQTANHHPGSSGIHSFIGVTRILNAAVGDNRREASFLAKHFRDRRASGYGRKLRDADTGLSGTACVAGTDPDLHDIRSPLEERLRARRIAGVANHERQLRIALPHRGDGLLRVNRERPRGVDKQQGNALPHLGVNLLHTIGIEISADADASDLKESPAFIPGRPRMMVLVEHTVRGHHADQLSFFIHKRKFLDPMLPKFLCRFGERNVLRGGNHSPTHQIADSHTRVEFVLPVPLAENADGLLIFIHHDKTVNPDPIHEFLRLPECFIGCDRKWLIDARRLGPSNPFQNLQTLLQ